MVFKTMEFGGSLTESTGNEKAAEGLTPEHLGTSQRESGKAYEEEEVVSSKNMKEDFGKGRNCYWKEDNDQFGQICWVMCIGLEILNDVTEHRDNVTTEQRYVTTEHRDD